LRKDVMRKLNKLPLHFSNRPLHYGPHWHTID
jgi:hypothetical protein